MWLCFVKMCLKKTKVPYGCKNECFQEYYRVGWDLLNLLNNSHSRQKLVQQLWVCPRTSNISNAFQNRWEIVLKMAVGSMFNVAQNSVIFQSFGTINLLSQICLALSVDILQMEFFNGPHQFMILASVLLVQIAGVINR